MFTPKQFATLNHFAHTQNLRNCGIRESFTTVSDIEAVGDRLMATVVSEEERGIFETRSVLTIGPRGGIRFLRTSHYVN